MQVSNPNNVKIYNISAGKTLPEWLTDKKKRALQKKDVDIRRRIELVQDFDMPTVSTCVQVSRDGQYILTTGTYKPRVRCYDVNQLSMKFERCFDSEVVKFRILSDDYSKLVFLQDDRHIEFHVQHGRYYRLRIPKFGRDLSYHYPSCDLFIVGAGAEIYRLNLELGQFLAPCESSSKGINVCEVNRVHHMLVCGTEDGTLEAWDQRIRQRIGVLNCVPSCLTGFENSGDVAVTSLAFKDGLTLGVGTSTGHVLLYDIRSDKPYLVKDHMNGLPIKDIEFHEGQNFVLSMDNKILKLWENNTGKPFTSINAEHDLNDLCLIQNTGMILMANENTKNLIYYIPGLGPAPKWCGFLDTLTEELEESNVQSIYEDYKFVTSKELEDLQLSHLIGTNLLRAYMHGYFMDMRLYKKAKAVAQPFEFSEFRKLKIKEKIEEDRVNRVKLRKLPSVNKDLALKLIDEEERRKAGTAKKKKASSGLLQDERFKDLFVNPDFEVDKNADEYRLLNPVVSRLDKQRKKELKQRIIQQQFETVEDENDDNKDNSDLDDDSSSSDDDREVAAEVKRQHKLLRDESKLKTHANRRTQPKFLELRSGQDFKGLQKKEVSRVKKNKVSLGERLKQVEKGGQSKAVGSLGNREMTFKLKKYKANTKAEEEAQRHHEERKKIRRSTFGLKLDKLPPRFWMGKRVK